MLIEMCDVVPSSLLRTPSEAVDTLVLFMMYFYLDQRVLQRLLSTSLFFQTRTQSRGLATFVRTSPSVPKTIVPVRRLDINLAQAEGAQGLTEVMWDVWKKLLVKVPHRFPVTTDLCNNVESNVAGYRPSHDR
uniref:Uncharacterized protein n=1 Tax=Steinernema glaseri TaxID=37863 RepID=A0A1I8ARH2_9BILA